MGPRPKNENKHSSSDKIGRLHRPLRRKKEKRTRSSTKEKHIALPTHDSQTRDISRTTTMPRATHKGITSATLGQWLVSLLCLHQYKWWLLNHWANKEITPEKQGLNRKGPNLTLSQWHTQSYIPSWSNSDRWSQWTYLQCSPRTPGGTTKMPAVITILIIEGTQRRIALH